MKTMTVKYSTSPDLSGAVITAGVTTDTDTDFTGKVDLSGLTPGTKYYYTLQEDGVDQSSSPYPSFTTFPAAGQPVAFSFVFGSCTGQSGSDSIFTAVPSDAAFLLHLGDTAYQGANTTLDQFRALQRQHLVGADGWCSHFKTLRAQTPVFTMWDDQDRGNGSQSGTGPVALQAFQEYGARANPDSPTAGALYYSFQVGDVGFFVPDERSYRSSTSATDNASKTLLGSAQLAILKDWLLTNNDTLKLKFICSETTASGYGTTGADSWGGDWTADQDLHYADGYRYERNGLWDFIDENGITGVVFLAGDQHWGGSFKAMYGQTTARPRYEFLATPYNQTVYPGSTYGVDPVNGPIFWKYNAGVNMGVVTVDTTVSPATVVFQLYGPSGSLGAAYSTSLTQDDIDLDLPAAAIDITYDLPAATIGAAYTGSITATNVHGATGAITLDAGTLNLPDGLTLGTRTGSGDGPYSWPVGGTPATDAVTETVHISVSNGTETATQDVDLVVQASSTKPVVAQFARAYSPSGSATLTFGASSTGAGDAWSTPQSGSVLLLQVPGSTGQVGYTPGAGWNVIDNSMLTGAPGTPRAVMSFWKYADGTESSITIAAAIEGSLYEISDAHPTAPIHKAGGAYSNGNEETVTFGPQTPTVANTLAIGAATFNWDAGGICSTPAGWTQEPPNNQRTGKTNLYCFTEAQDASLGSVSGTTTISPVGTTSNGTYLILIAPP